MKPAHGQPCYYCNMTAAGTPIHVIWGFHSVTGDALVITAYYPRLDRWESDLTTRRRR